MRPVQPFARTLLPIASVDTAALSLCDLSGTAGAEALSHARLKALRSQASAAARPLVTHAVSKILVPTREDGARAHPIAGISLQARKGGQTVKLRASYQVGPWGEIASQSAKINLKSGLTTLKTVRFDDRDKTRVIVSVPSPKGQAPGKPVSFVKVSEKIIP